MTTPIIKQLDPLAPSHELTPASVWQAAAGSRFGDHLLEWPPDAFAFTEVLLQRSEAHRFAISPPGESRWPPDHLPGWAAAVVDAARRWTHWVEDRSDAIPDLLAEEWRLLSKIVETPLEDLTRALVKQPQVLLADEPTGNLDEHTRDEIIALLEQLWRQNQLTLVMVTHDSRIARRAQHLGAMKKGHLTVWPNTHQSPTSHQAPGGRHD